MTGVPVIAQRLSGGPLALDKIAKQLDAVGVYEENPRTLVRAARLCQHRGMGVTPSRPAPMSAPSSDGWRTDRPTARHNWPVPDGVRLAAAYRRGCITAADHQEAQRVLDSRMGELCTAEDRAGGRAARGVLGAGLRRAARRHDDRRTGTRGAGPSRTPRITRDRCRLHRARHTLPRRTIRCNYPGAKDVSAMARRGLRHRCAGPRAGDGCRGTVRRRSALDAAGLWTGQRHDRDGAIRAAIAAHTCGVHHHPTRCLLSATAKRHRANDASGGLLRAIGDRGVLMIKDVTSILSMKRELGRARYPASRPVRAARSWAK